jgi:uncharacterized protein (TIGR00375 family)
VSLGGAELVDHLNDVGGLIGPAHAFTPWTALYKEYDSLRDCYQDNLKHIHFLELGLSSDTFHADRISELSDVTYLTNSDCHSPWPHRLGREFNRLDVKSLSFDELSKAIRREGDRRFTLNVGLNPLEGKYHLSACTRCYLKFSWSDAVKLKRRCPECNGLIKKGVVERINELADYDKPKHPSHRPEYKHILPLAEIIGLAYRIKSPTSKKVAAVWGRLVESFESEIHVLLEADIKQVSKVDGDVGRVLDLFRSGKVGFISGGGGMYGRPTLDGERDRFYEGSQKTLDDY